MKKILILLSIFLSCQLLLATSDFYLKEDFSSKKLFLKKGTKVQLIKELPNKKVKLKILAYKDKENRLFFDKTHIYQVGFLKKSGKSFNFVIEKEQLTQEAFEVWEEAEELYLEACTQCHAQMEPKEHSMLEWEAIFNSMKEQSQLEKEEEEKILDYLKSHSSDGFIEENE